MHPVKEQEKQHVHLLDSRTSAPPHPRTIVPPKLSLWNKQNLNILTLNLKDTTPIITTDEDPEESPGGMNGDARRWNDWDDFENEEF